ncbi:hypothetical protein BJ165DRAFT_1410366 [Panaeolus papilionaceus]|nr:hypothetical protein BJ165DRAFT_1410366 [Panaeolus papilionaceus]
MNIYKEKDANHLSAAAFELLNLSSCSGNNLPPLSSVAWQSLAKRSIALRSTFGSRTQFFKTFKRTLNHSTQWLKRQCQPRDSGIVCPFVLNLFVPNLFMLNLFVVSTEDVPCIPPFPSSPMSLPQPLFEDGLTLSHLMSCDVNVSTGLAQEERILLGRHRKLTDVSQGASSTDETFICIDRKERLIALYWFISGKVPVYDDLGHVWYKDGGQVQKDEDKDRLMTNVEQQFNSEAQYATFTPIMNNTGSVYGGENWDRMQLPFGPHPFPERFPQDTDNTKPSPTQHNPATSAGQGEFEYWSGLPASFSVDNASYKHIATPPTVQENRRPFEDHHMTGKKQTVIWTGLLKPTTTGSCCEDVGDRDSCEQELATWDGYINSTVWDMSYPNEAAHSNDFETWGGLEPALEFSVDSDTRTFSRLSQPSPPSKFSATSADFDATWQKNLTALLPNSLGNAPLVQDKMHLDAPVLTPLQQSVQDVITIWTPFSVFRSSPNLPPDEGPSQIVEVTDGEGGPQIESDTVKSSEASGSAYAVQVSRDHDDGAPSQCQLKLPTTKTSDSMMPTINTAILPSDDSVGSILYTSDSGSGLTRKKFIDIQAQVDIDQSPSTGQSLSTNSKVDQDHQASTPHVDPSTIFSSISTLTGNFEDQRSESTPTSMHGKGDALSEDSLADQPSDDLLTGLELLAGDDQSEPPVRHCKGSKRGLLLDATQLGSTSVRSMGYSDGKHALPFAGNEIYVEELQEEASQHHHSLSRLCPGILCHLIEHAYFSVPLEPGHTYTLIRQGACAVDVIACSRMPPDCPTLTAVNKDQRQSSPFEEVAQRSPTKSSARRESRRERRTRASSPTSSSNGATSLKPRNAAQPYRRPEASTSTQKAIAELKIDKKGKAKAAPVKFGYVVAEEGEGPCATFSSRAFVRLFIRNHANPEEVFYTNGESKSALEFLVGDNTVLPEVFSKAVQGMKLNETRRCIIPSDLAFGSSGNPRFGVPSDADLVIDIDIWNVYVALGNPNITLNFQGSDIMWTSRLSHWETQIGLTQTGVTGEAGLTATTPWFLSFMLHHRRRSTTPYTRTMPQLGKVASASLGPPSTSAAPSLPAHHPTILRFRDVVPNSPGVASSPTSSPTPPQPTTSQLPLLTPLSQGSASTSASSLSFDPAPCFNAAEAPPPSPGMTLEAYLAANNPALLPTLHIVLNEGYDSVKKVDDFTTMGSDLQQMGMEQLVSSSQKIGGGSRSRY